MPEPLLIGVDLGTTLNKVGVYDTRGNCLAQASRAAKVTFPRPGWAEQDPEDFYGATVSLIRECVEKLGSRTQEVVALAIDSQMGGILAINERWNAVTHYDPPLDTRATSYGELMNDRYGLAVMEKTAAVSTYGQKILYWLREHPEVSRRIYKFIQPSAYVAGRLAGLVAQEAYMDHTYLSWSGLCEGRTLCWSEELCQLFDVPLGKLPRIVDPCEIVGKLKAPPALECGLKEGIPIAAGAGDTSAAFLGAGIIRPGMLLDNSGTACSIAATVNEFVPDVENRSLAYLYSVIPELWHPLSFGLFGRSHRWFIEEFINGQKKEAEEKGSDIYKMLDEKAVQISPGSDGLLFIPHLQGRFLPAQPRVRGAWVGFTWGHKREHFYRAILESAAYDQYIALKILRTLFPHISYGEVRVIGGGARSSLWNQIKSDVLQVPHVQLNREEFATLGSAMIAGKAIGVFDNLETIAENFASPQRQFVPDRGKFELYRKYAEAYESLLADLKGIYDLLAEIRKD